MNTTIGRTLALRNNILASGFLKGLSISISLILVPLTIDYVDSRVYGVWLTLSSIVAWISILNLGLGNGLRNRLTECLAKDNNEQAKIYISTTYFITAFIFFCIWIIMMICNISVDWIKLMNIDLLDNNQIRLTVSVIITFVCLNFVLSLLLTVILSNQKPAVASLVNVLGQLTSLLSIYILTKIFSGSLFILSLGLCLPPLIILFIASLYFYNCDYRIIRPSMKFIDFSCSKNLFNIGLRFFVINIAGIIQYQTSNLLIIHFFGAEDVTMYNVAYKYFSVLNLVFSGIILEPLWSASTDAYAREDIQWIKDTVLRYIKLFFIFVILGLIMLFLSDFAFTIWLGSNKVFVPFMMSILMFLFFVTSMFAGIFISVLNGINAIRIQYYLCLISPVVFMLSTYVFVKIINLGIESIILASILSNFTGYIVAPIQYKKVIYNKRTGIWIK